jgi:hypothetical protein
MASMAYPFRILDQLGPELVRLQHRRRDALRQYERVLVRIAAFPNELEEARAAALADNLDEMGSRIDYLEAQLLPFRHDEI